jgi:hypothetical protein
MAAVCGAHGSAVAFGTASLKSPATHRLFAVQPQVKTPTKPRPSPPARSPTVRSRHVTDANACHLSAARPQTSVAICIYATASVAAANIAHKQRVVYTRHAVVRP